LTKDDILRWKESTTAIQKMDEDIDKFHADVVGIATEQKYIKEDVKEISTIVRGNGNPEHGMVYKLQELEHKFTTCQSNGMTSEAIKEAIKEAMPESKDNGDERRKNAFQRMTPKNKILIGIAITGFIFTYAVQIYSVAKAVFSTLVSQ